MLMHREMLMRRGAVPKFGVPAVCCTPSVFLPEGNLSGVQGPGPPWNPEGFLTVSLRARRALERNVRWTRYKRAVVTEAMVRAGRPHHLLEHTRDERAAALPLPWVV